MKKRMMAMVLAGAMALSMGVTAFAEEAADISIAFVMHAQNGSFYTKLSDGAEAAAADLGITVNVSAPNTASSLQDQISLLETAVASDVDGIATVTWDLSGFNGIIAEANEKGIPVIGFNQDAEGCGTVAFVGQAYEEAGYSLGKYMFDLMGGEGKYIIASCGPTDSALIAREAGIDRAAAEYDGVEKLETIDIGTDLTNAYGVIENALLAHPDCTAVLGVDVFSEAIGNVIEDQGLEGKVYAAGFDLTEGMLGHIKNGSVQLTVGQNPFLQGYYSVLELYLNKKYGSDFLNIDTGAQMVTIDNVDDVQPE